MEKYHRMSTPEEVDAWVKKYYTDEELSEVGENKSEALLYYKGNGYAYMNACIRSGIAYGNDKIIIDNLQLFLQSKRIKESIEVYRFVNQKELFILHKNTSKKRLFKYPGFLSTTLLKKHYSMESIKRWRIPIAIRIPKGTFGTYLVEINKYMPEYEVLLPYHTKLRRIKSNTFEVIL